MQRVAVFLDACIGSRRDMARAASGLHLDITECVVAEQGTVMSIGAGRVRGEWNIPGNDGARVRVVGE